jgi:hypothetical protein
MKYNKTQPTTCLKNYLHSLTLSSCLPHKRYHCLELCGDNSLALRKKFLSHTMYYIFSFIMSIPKSHAPLPHCRTSHSRLLFHRVLFIIQTCHVLFALRISSLSPLNAVIFDLYLSKS